MKNLKKICVLILMVVLVPVIVCACDLNNNSNCGTKEKLTLQNVVLSEVEFKNSENVSLKQSCSNVEVGGVIDAMTDAEKAVFGSEDVSHIIAVNLTFDKERTLSYLEIKGNKTKVYSTNQEDENYVGSLTDILDNESGEDAYCGLILSANTKNYQLTIKYTDGYESVVKIEINATLAEASVE